MNIIQICTWIAVIITIINALRFPYEFWMNLKWAGILMLVMLAVVLPGTPNVTVFDVIGGAFIFGAWIFMVWFFIVSFFLGSADYVDELLTPKGERLPKVKKQRTKKIPVVYGEPVETVDGYPVEDYHQLPARVPQNKRLLQTPIDAFNRTREPVMVDNFYTCSHCGTTQGFLAGFVNICTTCGRKL